MSCVAASILACGCSTTVALKRPISTAEADDINAAVRDRDAVVTYSAARNLVREPASNLVLTVADARWTRADPGSPEKHGEALAVPVDALRSIQFCGEGCRKPGQGALIGGLVGITAGFVLGYASGARNQELGDLRPLGGIVGIVVGGALGALLGAAVGARGFPTIIRFE